MIYIQTKESKMPKSIARTYSRYTQEASALLGNLIRAARKERKFTAQELADRGGISRGLLQRIEKGDPKCEIGAVFEVATIVGVKLFDADETTLTKYLRQAKDKLALLPKSVRKKTKAVRDDF
jgi:transcriptional regulator with XRE-family HTH domain